MDTGSGRQTAGQFVVNVGLVGVARLGGVVDIGNGGLLGIAQKARPVRSNSGGQDGGVAADADGDARAVVGGA